MELVLYATAMAVECLALLWVSKKAAGRLLAPDFDHQLTGVDNPAVAATAAGYLLGLFFALGGLFSAPGHGFAAISGKPHWRFWEGGVDVNAAGRAIGSDALWVAIYGLLAVPLMAVAARCAAFYLRVSLKKDVLDGRNQAAGIVMGASLCATGLIYGASISGEGGGLLPSLVFFAAGQVLLWVFAYVYELVLPFDFRAVVREQKNPAAAVAFAGAIVAMGLVVSNGVSGDFTRYATGFRDLALWSAPAVALYPVRKLVVGTVLLGGRNLDDEITRDRNLGAGLIEAAVYLGVAHVTVRAIGG